MRGVYLWGTWIMALRQRKSSPISRVVAQSTGSPYSWTNSLDTLKGSSLLLGVYPDALRPPPPSTSAAVLSLPGKRWIANGMMQVCVRGVHGAQPGWPSSCFE